MGQYYKLLCVNRREELSKNDYGAKLMESAWAGNDLTTSLYYMLMRNWSEKIVVNIGDYADTDKDWAVLVNKLSKRFKINSYPEYLDETKTYKSLYNTADDYKTVERKSSIKRKDLGRIYGLNLNKKEFVDLNVLPVTDVYKDERGETVYSVEPISLLVSMGNGLGGGDYHTEDDSTPYVGSWAGDRISVSEFIPEGYTEIVPNFKEYYEVLEVAPQFYDFVEEKFVEVNKEEAC